MFLFQKCCLQQAVASFLPDLVNEAYFTHAEYLVSATTVLLLPCQRNLTSKEIVQLDTVKQPYTGFLNTETCFNTVLALTLDNNMDIQEVEPSLLNCWQFFWSLLEKGKWIFLLPFPPPFCTLLHEGCLYLLLLFKEWLIWKPSLISQIVPSPFVLVLISRAPLDSKQKEHGQQKKRETQRTVSWDQLWGIWWLSASVQLCWLCWLEQLNSSKASGPRITFKTQRKKEGQMNGPPSRHLFHSNYYSCSALDTTVSVAKLICKETESCLTSSCILELACNW